MDGLEAFNVLNHPNFTLGTGASNPVVGKLWPDHGNRHQSNWRESLPGCGEVDLLGLVQTPDFLSRCVALMNCMRLSLLQSRTRGRCQQTEVGGAIATARNNDELYARKDIDAVLDSIFGIVPLETGPKTKDERYLADGKGWAHRQWGDPQLDGLSGKR